MRCFFSSGPLFYVEYNFRLFFYLLFQRSDAICAIDLDTILPVYFISIFRNSRRVYDAHELFTEMKEIVTRPRIHKIWKSIERFAVPRFRFGYTVNTFIQNNLSELYHVNYAIVRNLPFYHEDITADYPTGKIFIYQGAVNEGRGFETLIPSMKYVDAEFQIYGEGNFFDKTRQLIRDNDLEKKVKLMGNVLPEKLQAITPHMFAGIMIVENCGLSLYYSLANKFFDFMMAGIPQICIDFPEYKAINDQYQFAYMIPDIETVTLEGAMNKLICDPILYHQLKNNAMSARKTLNWQQESKILLDFYKSLFENE
ncbi:MAG: group 1 glycosyl transferase [Pseudopedobacter saltans]|uniref:Group 1 glycosyl transferase n=1 Tax=Pseudopedobacter saltans TaxID=151895 RepID=A0A2W5FBF6_9SPHI|nr:MAG: group 1 glycosyl transferase [Pseudopedobacter saltans]